MADFDQLLDQATKLAEAAVARDPKKALVGILIADRSSGAIEQKAVYWFSKSSELSAWLLKCFPFLFCGLESRNEIPEALRVLASHVTEGPIKQTTINELASIDEYVFDYIHVAWSGTFADLCAAKSEIARDLIAEFREQSGSHMSGPINDSERENFSSFLGDMQNS